MKNSQCLLLSFILFLSSCITIETTSTGFKDEIYYSVDKYYEVDQQEEENANIHKESDQEGEELDEEYYTDEYSSDDYYDYGYSVRLRRFHGPTFNFGYYNNYYTNSFWYSGIPSHCGMSVYYGYNFWNNNYYNPFYNYYNPYYHNPLYSHYHYHGYYNHLLAYNSYPTYYNSYDNNSIYYGPRDNNKNKTPEIFANRYISEVKNRVSQFQANKNNDLDKRPIHGKYTIQHSNMIDDKSPTNSKENNSNLNNKLNSGYNNSNYSKPANSKINSGKKNPIDKEPYNFSKPNYSKPRYSKPNKQVEYDKPSQNRTYSKPSHNSNRGGGSKIGRRPR